jgi:hypothetical protein
MFRFLLLPIVVFIILLSGCSSNDDQQKNPVDEQIVLEAPIIEDAPASTTKENVTVTVRTLPRCEVYVGDINVATADDQGIAYVILSLTQASNNRFEFKVKLEGRFSEIVSLSIRKQEGTSQNTSSQASSTSEQGGTYTSESVNSGSVQDSVSASGNS